jgi:hypothetical protein
MPLVCNCVQKMDLGDYTMVKERGMRNYGGTKITRGLDTHNMDLRMGPTLKFFQTVSGSTEIFHGYNIGMD